VKSLQDISLSTKRLQEETIVITGLYTNHKLGNQIRRKSPYALNLCY
jgi:hypothetical protein